MKIYGWNDKFDFGKFKDLILKDVYKISPNYIHWCLSKVEWFCLTEDAFQNLPIVKQYTEASGRFAILGDSIYKKRMDELQPFFDLLLQQHTEKTEILHSQESRSQDFFNYDYREESYDNWLADAAGTDDPETMNDVYWNLD